MSNRELDSINPAIDHHGLHPLDAGKFMVVTEKESETGTDLVKVIDGSGDVRLVLTREGAASLLNLLPPVK